MSNQSDCRLLCIMLALVFFESFSEAKALSIILAFVAFSRNFSFFRENKNKNIFIKKMKT